MELVLRPLSVLAWTFAKLPALFIVANEGRLVTGWVEAADEEEEEEGTRLSTGCATFFGLERIERRSSKDRG